MSEKDYTLTKEEYDEYILLKNEKAKNKENRMQVELKVQVSLVQDRNVLQVWTINRLTHPNIEDWLKHPMIDDITGWATKCVFNQAFVDEARENEAELIQLRKENKEMKKDKPRSLKEIIFGE